MRFENINYNGLSWRFDFNIWTNYNCDLCDDLNVINPVKHPLFYTHSRREFKKHIKQHKETV